MPLSAGTKLGPYEILEQIGAGGMGEVYRARDARLNRDVAIKISNSQFTERFEREARAVAALNHPHICQLYDVGPDFLVMEFIEGAPLRGPLPLDQVLRYAGQVCDALAAAHAKHITHRDLKPANILLTKAGVKLLDFGLAKINDKTSGAVNTDGDDTLTMALTTKGEIVGTLNYMSPEQIQGGESGPPSDIFSFGLVLYEMLTGKRAFKGTSPASVIAAILEREPPSLSGVAPEGLDRVLKRCLAKNPEDRWQSAHDLKLALEMANLGDAEAGTSQRISWGVWTALLVLAMTVVFLGLATYRHAAEGPPNLVKLSALPPEGARFENFFALSPDGKHVAFVAATQGHNSLWVRDLDSGAQRALPGTDDPVLPFWSPDSRSVGFFASGKLKRIDISGGPAQSLCDALGARGGSWGKGGVIIYAPLYTVALSQCSAAGGTAATPATELDSAEGENAHRMPWFLPDGVHFLYTARNNNAEKNAVYVGQVGSKERTRLFKASSNVEYVSPGYVLFLREQVLMAQPFDASKLETTGDAAPIAERIAYDGLNLVGRFSASQNGVLAYLPGGSLYATELAWFDRSGKPAGVIDTPGLFNDAAISPDGGTIAYSKIEPQTGHWDIWFHDVMRATNSRFTSAPQSNEYPVWSPDGKHVAYVSIRVSGGFVWQKTVGGAAREEVVDAVDRTTGGSVGDMELSDWSHDGRFLIGTLGNAKTKGDIWLWPMKEGHPDGEPSAYLHTEFNERFPKLSPDGHWLAYSSDETKRNEVYVQSFPNPGQQIQISVNGGDRPVWSRDGTELYFLGLNQRITVVPVKTGAKFEAGTPKELFEAHLGPAAPSASFDVSKDGRMLMPNSVGDSAAQPITVVLNWTTGLRK